MLNIKISASLLGCDLSDLKNEISKAENAKIDWVHYDVMDGSFVSNISFGEPVLKSIKKHISVPVDTHLMIENPIRYIDNYCKLRSDIVTFHYEATDDPQAVIDKIHSNGVKAGISIKPSTPANVVEKYLDTIDMVLVMTVNPGFGGQVFLPKTLEKVSEIRYMIDKIDREIYLQVDGGVNHKTAQICKQAGADVLVSGSYVFNAENMAEAVESLR